MTVILQEFIKFLNFILGFEVVPGITTGEIALFMLIVSIICFSIGAILVNK